MKLTDEQLTKCARHADSTWRDARDMAYMARELLLLRAECRAAREMRDSEVNFGRAQPQTHAGDLNRVRVDAGKDFDAARKATDDAGLAP